MWNKKQSPDPLRRVEILQNHLKAAESTARVSGRVAKQGHAIPQIRLSGSSATDRWGEIEKRIDVNISARHVHLTKTHLKHLFGEGHKLTPVAFLAGLPKEIAVEAGFASSDKVTIVGSKMGRQLAGVRILGPCRKHTQIELAYTDAIQIGIDAPVRISGDTKGSAPCIMIGPKGVLELKEGVIRAWRHIHMSPEQAAILNVESGELLAVRIVSPKCSVVLEDLMVRLVQLIPKHKNILKEKGIKLGLEVHLDTDEGNSCMVKDATHFELMKQNPTGAWTVIHASPSQK